MDLEESGSMEMEIVEPETRLVSMVCVPICSIVHDDGAMPCILAPTLRPLLESPHGQLDWPAVKHRVHTILRQDFVVRMNGVNGLHALPMVNL